MRADMPMCTVKVEGHAMCQEVVGCSVAFEAFLGGIVGSGSWSRHEVCFELVNSDQIIEPGPLPLGPCACRSVSQHVGGWLLL